MLQETIAVVGAGMAGLACARALARQGLRVELFDKGRSPGGRIATRRVEARGRSIQFDHGAQFVTARDPAFCEVIEALHAASAAGVWEVEFMTLADSTTHIDPPGQRIVGTPGMSALAKAMAAPLFVRSSSRVEALGRVGAGWKIALEDGRLLGPYTDVVCAIPAEQAAPLLAPVAPHLADEAAAAVTAPCWAGLFAFDRLCGFGLEALRLADHPVLAWIGLDSAKPGRNRDIHTWVVHARPDWSRAHLEDTPEDVAVALQTALTGFFDGRAEPIYAAAHRWRYALVERQAETPFAWDPGLRLGVCGDWRIGPRVEAAFLSGDGLARMMRA